MPSVRVSGYATVDASTDSRSDEGFAAASKGRERYRLNQPGVMRNARIATAVVAIVVFGLLCELLHDVNTDVALDSRRPVAKAGWLRVRIR